MDTERSTPDGSVMSDVLIHVVATTSKIKWVYLFPKGEMQPRHWVAGKTSSESTDADPAIVALITTIHGLNSDLLIEYGGDPVNDMQMYVAVTVPERHKSAELMERIGQVIRARTLD